ncbi:MAG: aa3-type cytochrome c oxidase subunit IV [Robiginitomaculum sp.]|nr:aa3-type cytochrome c oxidase subunit IV [Robiginitomaculum sp.]
MAEHSEYIHGNMPIDGQDKTFSGFVRLSAFFTVFFVVVLLMPILVFGANIAWFPALIATFIVGVILTPVFKLGGGWIATLIGLAFLTGLIGILVSVLN